MKFLPVIFTVVILLTSSVVNVTQAGLINNLNEHDGTGLSTNNIGSNWSRGWVFDVNIEDAWVTQLGFYTPAANTLNYTISLWDFTTQSLLLSTNASNVGSEWNWFEVEAFQLYLGQSYLISLYASQPSAYYYSSDPVLQPSGDIDYVQLQYCNNCAVDTFPTSSLTNINYGLVDFTYQIGQPNTTQLPSGLTPTPSSTPVSLNSTQLPSANAAQAPTQVPEPSTLVIFALGLFGIAFRRMKKSA